MRPSRDNPGVAHENGSIESPHGHLKRRIHQALLVRDSPDSGSVSAYQGWLEGRVEKLNRRNRAKIKEECRHLQPLPVQKAADYTELWIRVTSSSTISVRLMLYSMPSHLIGEHLRVHLYEEALADHWTLTQYLTVLCENEVAYRYSQRLQRYLKESCLPRTKTLSQFDFSACPKVNPIHIAQLAQNTDWVERADNLLIFGPSGVGKTHLATAIGHGLIEQGKRVYYTSTTRANALKLSGKQYLTAKTITSGGLQALLLETELEKAPSDGCSPRIF
jgi:hypothetical protein